MRSVQITLARTSALLAAAAALTLLGCGRDPQPRSYSEIASKELPPQGPMGMGAGAMMPPMSAPAADIKVTWTLPQGWTPKDSASGMRVGSFSAPDPKLAQAGQADDKAADISVVQLAGDAGGLKPNIARWMGQVGLISTPEALEDIIKSAGHFKTRTGQTGLYVDLTDKLSGDMTKSKTIFGAVIQTAEYTVFVKAMGERSRVLAHKQKVKTFCESLAIKGPQA